MKIETENYVITKEDKYNYILQMKTETKDSHLLKDKSKIGEKTLGEKLFFSNMGSVFKRIVDLSLANDSEVKSMNDISDKIDDLAKEFRSAI